MSRYSALILLIDLTFAVVGGEGEGEGAFLNVGSVSEAANEKSLRRLMVLLVLKDSRRFQGVSERPIVVFVWNPRGAAIGFFFKKRTSGKRLTSIH